MVAKIDSSKIADRSSASFDDDRTTVGDNLERFYRDHQLGADGGLNDSWAKVRIGYLSFYFPNTASRKRALLLHDVHHLATGYQTDLRGEAEIGAWEVASGCRDFIAAWVLNFMGFVLGLLIAPRRTFRAFVRGCHSTNLYHLQLDRQTILNDSVADMRRRLRLPPPRIDGRLNDWAKFAFWTSLAIVLIAGPVAVAFWLLSRWLS